MTESNRNRDDCLCRVAAEAWIAEQEAKAWKPTRAGVAGKAAEAPGR